MIELLTQWAGLFVILAFVHFVSDWIFQTHDDAMVKHKNHWVRARHCGVYAVSFIPVLVLTGMSHWNLGLALTILFVSHFIEDTYYPVFLWAKHVRKPPEFANRLLLDFKTQQMTIITEEQAFERFVATPLGKILTIVVDQIIHLAFLWIIAGLMMTGH